MPNKQNEPVSLWFYMMVKLKSAVTSAVVFILHYYFPQISFVKLIKHARQIQKISKLDKTKIKEFTEEKQYKQRYKQKHLSVVK